MNSEDFRAGLYIGTCLTVFLVIPLSMKSGKDIIRKEALSNGYGHIDSELKFQWNKKEK